MDLQTMESQVYSVLRDTERAFFDKEEVDAWLNEGQLDLAVRLELLQHEWTGTTTDENIAVPTDLVHALSLRIGTDDVQFVDDTTWNDYSDLQGSPPTTIARVFGSNFELYPNPGSASYKLRGVRAPEALIDPQDVPELPAHLHPKLLHYARYQSLLKEGSDRWQAYAALYAENLPPPPTGIIKLMPGPFTLTLQAGPWDTADSTHF
jgi:hypothetical protein